MVKNKKIKLDDLDKDSTPCEICVAMNDREVEKDGNGHYFNKNYCTYRERSGCIGADRAQMRIEFLNYFEHKKPKKE